MPTAEIITQGLTQGGIACFTIYMFTKFLMPKMDRIESKLDTLLERTKKCLKDNINSTIYSNPQCVKDD